MKTIIAGSREITDPRIVAQVIKDSGFHVTEVVNGGARGVDRLGYAWAMSNKVPVKQFMPDWYKHGKAAGPIRNQEMADYADALIAVWDGKSRGTKNMIELAKKKGTMSIFVKIV
jgi:hypothetical protein